MKKLILSLGAVVFLAACGAAGDTTPPPVLEQPPVIDETYQGGNLTLIEGLPFATASFTPGTFIATAPSLQDAPLTVSVSFSEDQITDIHVVDHSDSTYGSGWFFRAYPAVADQIFVQQSTQGLDAFVGATITKTAIISAVEDAIVQAGANPADLTPQLATAPLPGDKFRPGFYEVTVPVNTMNIYGEPLQEGDTRMLYSEEQDMIVRVSVGRNYFHVNVGSALVHGETALTAADTAILGGTWGGWFFRQMAHHQINDTQSLNVDTNVGATKSASAIVWAVEQALLQAGGDPSQLTPISGTRYTVNPSSPDARFLLPGYYTVTVDGAQGPIELTVTVDRNTIRRITANEQSETPAYWEQVWPAIRDYIYEEQTTHILDEVDTFVGATVSAEAVIEAVRQALQEAGESNENNW
ncbi:MAG: FMN-binding protein [Defluviitaleaceae bacterium]|nr:FMN-binding protein [Defluviitaleaceae bacterium]